MPIDFQRIAEVSVIRVSGLLTCNDSQGFVSRFTAWLDHREPTRCVLDVADLKMLDSSGIGAIVSCLHKVRTRKGDLVIAGAQGRVATVLKIARVDQFIRLFATVDEAQRTLASVGQ
jgi:anti-sigma B factor antagonist